MAVFRIERTRDYTVMSNHHLRNHELSLKAKGLLSMMLSLPDDWNYTTRGLAKICKEGVDAIGNALRELETAGYIVRNQLRDRQGRISDTEYVIYEQPQPKNPDTPQPDTASPDTENPDMEKPDTEKPAELNIEKPNTQKQNTHRASTDSIPFRETAAVRPPERKGRDAMSVSEMESYRDLILENIEYDHLCREFTLRHNVNQLQSILTENCTLMPAVKANAYGHGAVLIAKELNHSGIRSFCVATVSEGMELRRGGVKGEILVLGYTHPEQFSSLRKYRLTQTVIDMPYARLLNAYGKKLKVHLKIDTGMHRLGISADQPERIASIFQMKNLAIEGIFTHLCVADEKTVEKKAFTLRQAEAFQRVICNLNDRGLNCGKTHLLSSYGLLRYPELAGDYARVGIALYGVLSNRRDLDDCPIALRPVLSLKARIALTKDLHTGEGAGYGLEYVAESDRKIAVLSIGYADGIPRALSCNHGKVLIWPKLPAMLLLSKLRIPLLCRRWTCMPTMRSCSGRLVLWYERCG